MLNKIYYCAHCHKIIYLLNESKVPTICCGQTMNQLAAGVIDASKEKHVPVVSINNHQCVITVGSINHPMVEEHYIEWLLIETSSGHQVKYLKPGEAPTATFYLVEGEKLQVAYAYCNLHGLWRN